MNFVSLHTPRLHVDHIIVQVHPPTQGWPPSATTLRSSFHSVWLLLCAPYLWARLFISAPYLWARKGEALICGHEPAAEMQMMVVSTFFLLPVVATIFPLSDFQTNLLLLILSSTFSVLNHIEQKVVRNMWPHAWKICDHCFGFFIKSQSKNDL